MNEKAALEWLLDIRKGVERREDTLTLVNEVVRYLIEWHCPTLVAEARAELDRAAPEYDGS